jgi:hypothetical protein
MRTSFVGAEPIDEHIHPQRIVVTAARIAPLQMFLWRFVVESASSRRPT